MTSHPEFLKSDSTKELKNNINMPIQVVVVLFTLLVLIIGTSSGASCAEEGHNCHDCLGKEDCEWKWEIPIGIDRMQRCVPKGWTRNPISDIKDCDRTYCDIGGECERSCGKVNRGYLSCKSEITNGQEKLSCECNSANIRANIFANNYGIIGILIFFHLLK